MAAALAAFEEQHAGPHNRLFYLALPPSVYPAVTAGLKAHCRVRFALPRLPIFPRDVPHLSLHVNPSTVSVAGPERMGPRYR